LIDEALFVPPGEKKQNKKNNKKTKTKNIASPLSAIRQYIRPIRIWKRRGQRQQETLQGFFWFLGGFMTVGHYDH
jgi:hypothetical protein